MIDKISNLRYSTSFRGSVVSNQVKTTEEVKEQPSSVNDFPASKDAAFAIKSYTLISTNSNPIAITKPISLQDYKKQLLNSGFVENKDFEISRNNINGQDFSTIYIKKDGDGLMPVRSVSWYNGEGIDNYDGYKDYQYSVPKGENKIIASNQAYDKNGNLDYVSGRIQNPTDSELFPKFINFDTKPEDYIKSLKDNNIDYTIEENSIKDGRRIVFIKESSDGCEKRTHFYGNLNDDFFSIYQDATDEKGRYCINLDNHNGRKEIEITEFS